MTRALTVRDRAEAYAVTFPEWPASHPWIVQEDGHDVLYARWVIGALWGNETEYYGAHPRTYLERAGAFFPDLVHPGQWTVRANVLHAFSGSLPRGPYWRLDLNPRPLLSVEPEIVGSVYDLGERINFTGPLDLVFADPPYADEDAEKYGTPMIDRLRATNAIARVVKVGGFLVWLDTTWPMHDGELWRTVGRIALTRATNHRTRDVTIFERVAA